MSGRVEIIGDCTLYLGDCRDILPTLEPVDAVVTDPPYGIGIAANPVRQKHERKQWDSLPPSDNLFALLKHISREQIIWGGNYFALGPSQGFLVWDKKQPENFSLAMCEMAWFSKAQPAKMFRYSVTGYSKQHPTQKPVPLMKWCLEYVPEARTVLDPFMGSGTTLVACAEMGRAGIGIEQDETYFDVACHRVERAYDQRDMFALAPDNTPDLIGLPLGDIPAAEISEIVDPQSNMHC